MTGSDTMGGGMYGSDRDGVRAAFAGGAVSFWEALDALVGGAEIVVDRPRGSHHPDFPEFVYELDYGYLKGTTSADGEGIDVWIGSDPRRQVTGALCTVDLVKHDAELKILVGCTAGDCAVIRRFYRTPLSAVRILRTAVFQQVNQKIFCSSSSSAQPSGVRRHWRLRPHSTNPARRKRARLAALSGATLHHS